MLDTELLAELEEDVVELVVDVVELGVDIVMLELLLGVETGLITPELTVEVTVLPIVDIGVVVVVGGFVF